MLLNFIPTQCTNTLNARLLYCEMGDPTCIADVTAEPDQTGPILFNKILSCFSETTDYNLQVMQPEQVQRREL